MKPSHNHNAPKKPTNVSINSDLLARARSLKLNLSATLESALVEEVRRAERAEWLKQNGQAIDASNEFTDTHGLFADTYRIL